MFSTQITISPFVHIFDIISLFAVELEEPKIWISGKGIAESILNRITASCLWINHHLDFLCSATTIYQLGYFRKKNVEPYPQVGIHQPFK